MKETSDVTERGVGSLGCRRRSDALDAGAPSREDRHGRPEGGTFMARMMADCRRWPSETNCSLVIIGEEDEVVLAAAEHAASVHGHENNEELRAQLRDFLEPADHYTPERQAEGALPG